MDTMGKLAEAVGRSMGQIADRIQARADGWYNAITGLGGGRDKSTGGRMYYSGMLQPEALGVLYEEDDLAATICDALPEWALVKGFSFEGDDEGALSEAFERWGGTRAIQEAATWARVYGAGAILLGSTSARMDSPRREDEPIDYLAVLDRTHLSIDQISLSGATFGRPETYFVSRTGRADNAITLQGSRVHASRLIMMEGEKTTAFAKDHNGGWCHSSLKRPYEILRDTATNWASVRHLLSDANQSVMKIAGLIDMIVEGDAQLVQNRMEIMNTGRSLAKAVVLDAESESFEQVGVANLANADKILEKTWQRLAASARMPVTVLMGMSPAGMNATGESDLEIWYARVAAYQTRELGPAIRQLAKVIAATEGIVLESYEVTWQPLRQMSESEQAAARKTVAETDAIYIASGVVLPEEVNKARWGQGSYSPDMAHALEPDARENALQRELEALMSDVASPEPETQGGPAQAKAVLDIIGQVTSGKLPRETAVKLISAAFGMPEESASDLLGPIGNGFEPDEPTQEPPQNPPPPPPPVGDREGLPEAPGVDSGDVGETDPEDTGYEA